MPQIPYNELQLLPLDKKYDLSTFNSTNTDLNEFLKNYALENEDNLVKDMQKAQPFPMSE